MPIDKLIQEMEEKASGTCFLSLVAAAKAAHEAKRGILQAMKGNDTMGLHSCIYKEIIDDYDDTLVHTAALVLGGGRPTIREMKALVTEG